MKKIIVPTDFSDCANDALNVAADLARLSGADIHLVHVYEKPLSGLTLQIEVDARALKIVRDRLNEEMDSVIESDLLKDIKLHKHLIADKRLWQVITVPELEDADLIVMGTHGASGVNEFFVGSNVQKVIQMSDVPVLSIKEHVDILKVNDIVFASNFFKEAEDGFEGIKAFAENLNARLHLLKVITPTNFEESQYSDKLMSDFAAKFNLQDCTQNTCVDRTLERGIIDFSNSINADMIALETHGRTGFSHMVQGSTAEDIANHAHLPLLTTKIETKEVEYGAIFP